MMYEISFEKNGVYQANLIDAPDARTARDWFEEQKPDATICGIDEFSGMMKPGIPVHCVPDGWKSLADRIKERQEEIYAITRGEPADPVHATEEESPVSTISAALNGLDALRARVTVYVPATAGTADAADNAREVDAVATALSTWFGGATIQPGSGCWMSDACGPVKEATTMVYAACTSEQLAAHIHIAEVLDLCRRLIEH